MLGMPAGTSLSELEAQDIRFIGYDSIEVKGSQVPMKHWAIVQCWANP